MIEYEDAILYNFRGPISDQHIIRVYTSLSRRIIFKIRISLQISGDCMTIFLMKKSVLSIYLSQNVHENVLFYLRISVLTST